MQPSKVYDMEKKVKKRAAEITPLDPRTRASQGFMLADLAKSGLTPEDFPYGVMPLPVKNGLSGYRIYYDHEKLYWRDRFNREEDKYISPYGKPAQVLQPADMQKFRQQKFKVWAEGEKKAAAFTKRTGLLCVGIPGAWGWCEHVEEGEEQGIKNAMLEPLSHGDIVVVLIDGDWRTNEGVARATATIAMELEALGIQTRFPDLGAVGGVDDWLVANKDLTDLSETFKALMRLPVVEVEKLEVARTWALKNIQRFNNSHVGLSDLGNATLMLRLTGVGNLRYMKDVKEWVVWDKDKNLWTVLSPKQLDHANCVAHYYELRASKYEELGRDMPEADPNSDAGRARKSTLGNAKALKSWAAKCASVPGRKNLLEDAGGRPGVVCKRGEFDTDPNLLGVANGVIDLRTGELLEEVQEHMVLNHAPTRYTGLATEPASEGALRAKKFITEITALAHGKPDALRMQWLARHLGAALRGRNSLTTLEIWTGSGANGKTALANLIQATLGQYSGGLATGALLTTRAPRDAQAASPMLMHVLGKRITFSPESADTAHLEEAMFKLFTGGDKLTIRPNYGDPADYDNTVTPILLCNEPPHVANGDHATWRRISPFEFRCVWSTEARPIAGVPKADLWISGEMANDEGAREWCLWWMVSAGVAWGREGLGEKPEDLRMFLEEYEKAEDIFSAWMDDEGWEFLPGEEVPSSILYESYKGWCMKVGRVAASQTTFTTRLKKKYLGKLESKKTMGPRLIVGLRRKVVKVKKYLNT